MADERSQASEPIDLSESVAGEEDPGASLDMPAGSARRPEVSAMDCISFSCPSIGVMMPLT